MNKVNADNGTPRHPESAFSLGLFGDTRSGKTVYLTALQYLAEQGQHPPGVEGLRPGDSESARYLGRLVAQVRDGRWPEGTIHTTCITLLLDTPAKTVVIRTQDFRGGDFGNAWYEGDHEDTQRFVAELFGGTSAAVFLVDPGAVKDAYAPDATIAEQEARERRVTGVVTALEILRKQSHGFHLFHRPVAVAFTKGDEHPEVMADPEGFARSHMRQTYDYLRRHAGRRYGFFGLSRTAPLSASAGPRPQPLKTEGIHAPVLWCAQQDRERTRLKRWTLCTIVAIVLVFAYAWLYAANAKTLRDMRSAIATANTQAMAELYQQATDMHGSTGYALTHPVERERVRQEIVGAAEADLDRSLANRTDAEGNLRTIPDYREAADDIEQFQQDYTGTENANRLDHWLEEQRVHLAGDLIAKADKAADAGNEAGFNDIEEQYQVVATDEHDKQMQDAREKLYRRLRLSAAKRLALVRGRKPSDIVTVREACREAEEELKAKVTSPDEQTAEYVRLVREVYDDLHANGTIRRYVLSHVQGENNFEIKCTIEVFDSAGESLRQTSNWRTPRKTDEGYSYHVQTEFSIDLMAEQTVRFVVVEDTWLRNGKATVERTAEELARLCNDGDGTIACTTDEGTDFTLMVSSTSEMVHEHFEKTKRLEELEDAFLRQSPQ